MISKQGFLTLNSYMGGPATAEKQGDFHGEDKEKLFNLY
jgi:hypothetical protein